MTLRKLPAVQSAGPAARREIIMSFLISAAASVAAYYICKWLDGKK